MDWIRIESKEGLDWNNYHLLILGWSHMKDVMFLVTLVCPRPQNALRLKEGRRPNTTTTHDYLSRKHLSKYSFKWENRNTKTIANIFHYLRYSNSWGLKSVSGNSHHARVRDWVYQDRVDEGLSFLAVDLERK